MRKSIHVLAILALVLFAVIPAKQAAAATDSGSTARSVARTEVWKAITSGNAGSASVAIMERGLLNEAEQWPTPLLQAQPAAEALKGYEGYYCNGNDLQRVSLEQEKGLLKRYAIEDAAETALPALLHNAGRFYSGKKDDKNALYFKSVEGTSYMMNSVALFGVDMVACEKLIGLLEPKQLGIDVDGKKWLRRNVKAYEGTMGTSGHIIRSHLPEALPGYVDFGGVKRIEGADFAGAAVHSTRDLTELRLLQKDGQTWAWLSGMLFMPAELAKKVEKAETDVEIGSAGYNEWLQVGTAAVLSIAGPENGRSIVFDASGAVLYDSALTRGPVFAPAGSWLELAGAKGERFSVTLREIQ